MDRQLRVERAPLSTLVADPANPRTHDARNLDAIADSLRVHGQVEPLLVQAGTRMVIAGNGRAEAMRSLGWTHAQVVVLDVDDKQARALSIKLNRTAELAGWDESVLQQHLRELDAWTDTGWDADLFGFTGDELDAMFDGLEQLTDPSTPSEPGAPAEPSAPAEPGAPAEPVRLVAQFGAPPFTLLDSRRGFWQDRKRSWWATGLSSTAGREELVPSANTAEGKYEYFSGRGGANGAAGGSAFDPVLAELSYRWFMPADGHVLDPFAGESVKGVVAGLLGYDYTGVEVRPEQVEANRQQWSQVVERVTMQQAGELEAGTDTVVSSRTAVGLDHTITQGVDHPLVREALDLVNGTSGASPWTSWGAQRPGIVALLRERYKHLQIPLEVETAPDDGQRWPVTDNGTAWVAFSGGKDSMAQALLLREQGYTPILYHVHGLNRAYPREQQWARLSAAAAGMQIVVDQMKVRGKGPYLEAPFKNQLLAGMLVSRMIQAGGNRYSLGNHVGERLENPTPTENTHWSDAEITVARYDEHLRTLVPGLQSHVTRLNGDTHALAVCARAGLLHLIHGCILPNRYRARVRGSVERKTGTKLLPGRCGTCLKCTREELILQELGIRPRNEKLVAHSCKRLRVIAEEVQAGHGKVDPLSYVLDREELARWQGTSWPEQIDPDSVELPTDSPTIASERRPTPTWIHGDSAQLDAALPAGAVYDGCVTSPPYYDLEVYSDNASDGSTLGTYPEFIAWYAGIWRQTVARLRDGAFVVVKVGDVRDEQGALRGFVHDNVQIFRDLGLSFYNDAVLATPAGTAPLRASLHFRAGRKLSKVHQHVLVFYKGDPRKIRQQIGELPDRYVAVPGVDT